MMFWLVLILAANTNRNQKKDRPFENLTLVLILLGIQTFT